MSSLAKSIAVRWLQSDSLGAVTMFTGRTPETELYNFPYVNLLISKGRSVLRTDKTKQFYQVVTFSIWVDGERLAEGETIANLIEDLYADQTWRVDDLLKVMDVLSDGGYDARQVPRANIKAWNLDKIFMIKQERQRVDSGENCGSQSDTGLTSQGAGSGSGSWPTPGSISSQSGGEWPQTLIT